MELINHRKTTFFFKSLSNLFKHFIISTNKYKRQLLTTGDIIEHYTTVPPQYNEPYVLADQAFVISKFVNAITNYSV
jgi:hypothetical protein